LSLFAGLFVDFEPKSNWTGLAAATRRHRLIAGVGVGSLATKRLDETDLPRQIPRWKVSHAAHNSIIGDVR
jgi:hypothetical protein